MIKQPSATHLCHPMQCKTILIGDTISLVVHETNHSNKLASTVSWGAATLCLDEIAMSLFEFYYRYKCIKIK